MSRVSETTVLRPEAGDLRENRGVRSRQFRQLASLAPAERTPLLIAGLEAIGRNVRILAEEVKRAKDAGAHRAAQIVANFGSEEAGKFLILIDAWRAPWADEATLKQQYGLAADHLAKLIYAQMVDYSIASRQELHRAIQHHRRTYYLDGPNDFDWVVANQLKGEREAVLYVDLVEWESELHWRFPVAEMAPIGLMSDRPTNLVAALMASGLVSEAGKQALGQAWADFDLKADSTYENWRGRTMAALNVLTSDVPIDAAQIVLELWPMPMVGFELSEDGSKVADLIRDREAKFQAMLEREAGFECDQERF